MGFRRGKTTQNENHALVKVEGLNDRKEVSYYQGKRIVYIHKTKKGYRVRIKFLIFRPFGVELLLLTEITVLLKPHSRRTFLPELLEPLWELCYTPKEPFKLDNLLEYENI